MKKVITPFEVAVDLVRTYAERGDDVDQFKKGGLGHYGSTYHASVGGFIWLEDEPKEADGRVKHKKVPNTKIIVSKIGKKLVNVWVGLFAALFLTLSFFNIQFSHFTRPSLKTINIDGTIIQD